MDDWTYKLRLRKIEKRLAQAQKDLEATVSGAAERVQTHKEAMLLFVLTNGPRDVWPSLGKR